MDAAYWLHPSQCQTWRATSPTSFTRYAVALQCFAHTSLTIFLQACDVPIPPMNPLVPEASTELPPRVVVATQEQVAAANKRRTNAIPGRFVCKLCPQNFTAKHNLKSQSQGIPFLSRSNLTVRLIRSYQFALPEENSPLHRWLWE